MSLNHFLFKNPHISRVSFEVLKTITVSFIQERLLGSWFYSWRKSKLFKNAYSKYCSKPTTKLMLYNLLRYFTNLPLSYNRQQPSPLLYSIDIWPTRNSRLKQRETNHYITRCANELAWPYLAGRSPGQLVIDLFAKRQQFAVCCQLFPRAYLISFFCDIFCQNHFGNLNRLKIHIGGCKDWYFTQIHPLMLIFKRFGCPKWFWKKLCHTKAGQVEPFLS